MAPLCIKGLRPAGQPREIQQGMESGARLGSICDGCICDGRIAAVLSVHAIACGIATPARMVAQTMDHGGCCLRGGRPHCAGQPKAGLAVPANTNLSGRHEALLLHTSPHLVCTAVSSRGSSQGAWTRGRRYTPWFSSPAPTRSSSPATGPAAFILHQQEGMSEGWVHAPPCHLARAQSPHESGKHERSYQPQTGVRGAKWTPDSGGVYWVPSGHQH